jgi:hypothetical protein
MSRAASHRSSTAAHRLTGGGVSQRSLSMMGASKRSGVLADDDVVNSTATNGSRSSPKHSKVSMHSTLEHAVLSALHTSRTLFML